MQYISTLKVSTR